MALKTAANGVVQREGLTCPEGFILLESRRVPTLSFLDEIRTTVGETLGGAGKTGVPGIGRKPRPFFENP